MDVIKNPPFPTNAHIDKLCYVLDLFRIPYTIEPQENGNIIVEFKKETVPIIIAFEFDDLAFKNWYVW